MDTELLKTFLEVRNTRHFGRAAENLHITQAAVSARIRQLEDLLGETLFVRSRNNIRLTSEGERLVPHAETVLLAWWRARQAVRLQGVASAQLYVGLRAGTWTPALQKKFRKLRSALPDLALRVDARRPDEAVRMLLDGTLDVALLGDLPSLTELRSIEVGSLTLRLFSSGGAVDLDAAEAEDYVYVDWGYDFDRFHRRQIGDRLVPGLRTNLPDLALDHLDRGAACAYFPASMKAQLASDGIRPVGGAPQFERPLNLVFNADSPEVDSIERMAQSLDGLKV